ncbi:unnamed protein product [Oncorhynchus mykiss]|uniref:Uncharacterized protein n=1 Tax=Oncorhynchus mykiss TaxID=8022 RepID=A0A060YJB7_ONCMY|nr:unnamed protein product [Oncorhynchus mykiss]
MWVCNLCRKQQEILTKSGEWFSGARQMSLDGGLNAPATGGDTQRGDRKLLRSRSQAPPSSSGNAGAAPDGTHQSPTVQAKGVLDTMPASRARSEPPRDKKRPLSLHEQNGKPGGLGRGRGGRGPPGKLQTVASQEEFCGPGDIDWRDDRHLEKVRSHDYPDGGDQGNRPDLRRRPPEEDELERKRRQEEEFQARYRSDPNLARYPVKPQKEEQEMRMHAKVSKVRHERRHSNNAINEVGLEGGGGGGGNMGDVPENRLRRGGGGGGGEPDRKASVENHRAYSMDRTVGGGGGGGMGQGPQGGSPLLKQNQNHGPFNHLVVAHERQLDPNSQAAMMHKARREKPGDSLLRKDSQSSDQSESLRPPPPRPYKSKRGVNKRQMSISSSEEEGASTPEYTSCEDVDMESVSEKGQITALSLSLSSSHVNMIGNAFRYFNIGRMIKSGLSWCYGYLDGECQRERFDSSVFYQIESSILAGFVSVLSEIVRDFDIGGMIKLSLEFMVLWSVTCRVSLLMQYSFLSFLLFSKSLCSRFPSK